MKQTRTTRRARGSSSPRGRRRSRSVRSLIRVSRPSVRQHTSTRSRSSNRSPRPDSRRCDGRTNSPDRAPACRSARASSRCTRRTGTEDFAPPPTSGRTSGPPRSSRRPTACCSPKSPPDHDPRRRAEGGSPRRSGESLPARATTACRTCTCSLMLLCRFGPASCRVPFLSQAAAWQLCHSTCTYRRYGTYGNVPTVFTRPTLSGYSSIVEITRIVKLR